MQPLLNHKREHHSNAGWASTTVHTPKQQCMIEDAKEHRRRTHRVERVKSPFEPTRGVAFIELWHLIPRLQGILHRSLRLPQILEIQSTEFLKTSRD